MLIFDKSVNLYSICISKLRMSYYSNKIDRLFCILVENYYLHEIEKSIEFLQRILNAVRWPTNCSIMCSIFKDYFSNI